MICPSCFPLQSLTGLPVMETDPTEIIDGSAEQLLRTHQCFLRAMVFFFFLVGTHRRIDDPGRMIPHFNAINWTRSSAGTRDATGAAVCCSHAPTCVMVFLLRLSSDLDTRQLPCVEIWEDRRGGQLLRFWTTARCRLHTRHDKLIGVPSARISPRRQFGGRHRIRQLVNR